MLWDIDHTLIKVRGLSREIYGDTFRKITGRPLERVAEMAGRTDLAITAETLRFHGIEPSSDLLATFVATLADGFAERRDELRSRGGALPGAHAALEALAARDDVVQSVLTGNLEPIARYKLHAFGLNRFVDFDIGAYGLDHTDRPPLVALAQQRARHKYGHRFDAASTVLVGDTVRDVEAGHKGGARVVAVATGTTSAAALRVSGADLVLTDLADTNAVVRAVLHATPPDLADSPV